ncbi:hypothetical protein [Paraglaciecola arctica]|uniref:hypothetical protein n=1 Tax=Paraglaciecola arctica TaxID=1128911 RepID=UPI001C065108|nr:hypothetical protein [Paraglaciecola arctica]MBU3005956.1 hypothetical protein [Paraglaciecola arctica]
MIFDEQNTAFLSNKLCISITEFEAYLSERFGSKSQCFNALVSFLIKGEAKQKLPYLDVMNQSFEWDLLRNRAFEYIRASFTINDDQEDYLYETICYFCWYYSGGLKELFKHRQADNEGP